MSRLLVWLVLGGIGICPAIGADEPRVYDNRLTLLENPPPLLADYPEFVEPVRELRRFEAPRLVNDEGADLSVRAWRFSYNARGIIEMPNLLRASQTAVIMVHPWGIDDGQGGLGRSDSILLVHIDTVARSMSALSIPRDTRIPVGGGRYGKINAAHAHGGDTVFV